MALGYISARSMRDTPAFLSLERIAIDFAMSQAVMSKRDWLGPRQEALEARIAASLYRQAP